MHDHHTKTKGDLGVLKAQLDLYKKGYMILIPQTEHAPFDLVAYKNDKFLRVQVKYRAAKGGSIQVNFHTCWTDKHGTHTKDYDKSEIDLMCVYCPDTDKCYYINPNECSKNFSIRLLPSKNNQKVGVNLAKNYEEITIMELKRTATPNT